MSDFLSDALDFTVSVAGSVVKEVIGDAAAIGCVAAGAGPFAPACRQLGKEGAGAVGSVIVKAVSGRGGSNKKKGVNSTRNGGSNMSVVNEVAPLLGLVKDTGLEMIRAYDMSLDAGPGYDQYYEEVGALNTWASEEGVTMSPDRAAHLFGLVIKGMMQYVERKKALNPARGEASEDAEEMQELLDIVNDRANSRGITIQVLRDGYQPEDDRDELFPFTDGPVRAAGDEDEAPKTKIPGGEPSPGSLGKPGDSAGAGGIWTIVDNLRDAKNDPENPGPDSYAPRGGGGGGGNPDRPQPAKLGGAGSPQGSCAHLGSVTDMVDNIKELASLMGVPARKVIRIAKLVAEVSTYDEELTKLL